MTKTKYCIYYNHRIQLTIITSTRNCEDMLNTIRDDYEIGNYRFKITRQASYEEVPVLIYDNKIK